MTPGTALALFLLGIAAALRQSKQSRDMQQWLSTFAAVIALLIGLAMIAHYALDLRTDLNQFLGGQGATSAQPSSPPTAVALILLAAAILLYDARPTLAAWFVFCAGLIAITALLAFLFGATPLYQLSDSPVTGVPPRGPALKVLQFFGGLLTKGVAVPTALVGFLIALGLTLERPDTGVMRIFTSPGPGGELFRHIAPVAILAPVVFGLVTARALDAEDIALALSVLTVLTAGVSVFLLVTTVARFSGFVSTSADAVISIDEDQRIMSFSDNAEKIFGWSQAQAIGKPIDILIPQRFRDAHARHVKGFAAGPGTARRMGGGAAITGLRMNGDEFLADSSISAIVVNRKKFLVVVLRDISDLKRSETEQRLLAEVGVALAETLELDDILTIIARLSVRDLADYCIVDVVEDDGSIRRARAVCRNPDRTWICDALMRTPLDGDRPRLAWPVLKTGKATLIEKVTPDALTSWARNDEERSALHSAHFRSLIAAPLLARGKLLGALVLVSEGPDRRFGKDDLRMAEAFAQQAAFFVENARLYRAAKRATQARDDMLALSPTTCAIPLRQSARCRRCCESAGPSARRARRFELPRTA